MNLNSLSLWELVLLNKRVYLELLSRTWWVVPVILVLVFGLYYLTEVKNK